MEKFLAKSFNQLAKSAYGKDWGGVEAYVEKLSQPLVKALATSSVAGQSFSNGQALVLQNLDSIMTSVLFTEEQLVKQRFIDRVPSINPIYQWNRRNSYGTNRGAMGFAEGGIGPVGNASWSRNQETVRFFGVQRGTTIVANLAGALGGMFDNPVEEEEYDGTMQLLSSVERSLIWGNSQVTDGAGNPIFYDGMYRKLRYGGYDKSNIIDLRGQPLTFDIFSEIAALQQKNYITNTRNMAAFLDPDTLQTLQLQKNLAERRMMGTSPTDGGFVAGTPLKGYDTQIGFVPFVPDVFLDPVQNKVPLTTADQGAPNTPAGVTTAVAAPSGGQVSKWANTDAGSVYYSVGAYNAAGESLPFVTTAAAATAGSIVTLTIPNVAGAFGYRIYRGTISSGSDAQWIGEVAGTGASVTFVDDNYILPGTNVSVIFEKAQQNIVMPQMAPLLKLPLAIQNTTIPFGLLYLHTLAVKAPERQFMIINIGKTGYTL